MMGGGTKEWKGNERQHGMMVREDECIIVGDLRSIHYLLDTFAVVCSVERWAVSLATKKAVTKAVC